MKKLTAIILSAALLAALAGCAQQSANVNPVGFDAAKAAALQAAGVAEADARFEDVSLKEYKGQQYYEIDFEVKDRDYEYYIEAFTGAVITPELAAEALGVNAKAPAVEKQPEQPAAEEVKPAVEAPKQEAPKAEKPADPQLIGESKAKSIALSHAGKKEADVKFVRTELDRDDGRTVYEVEFYDGDFMEYDYDIDAHSGDVISFDYDAEGYKKPAESKPSDSGNKAEGTISESKAKEIALAQVPGAKESDIRKFEVDRDDGRIEYEGEIVYDGMEYEFEIDGYSGAIRNWDVERFEKYDD